jgi:hypothetical protein
VAAAVLHLLVEVLVEFYPLRFFFQQVVIRYLLLLVDRAVIPQTVVRLVELVHTLMGLVEDGRINLAGPAVAHGRTVRLKPVVDQS